MMSIYHHEEHVSLPKVDKLTGELYGSYIELPFHPPEEEISKAKVFFVEQICETIRQLAERDDFFILKDGYKGLFPWEDPYTALGWKIMFPTLKRDKNFTEENKDD